jgi:hypothetical protein
VFRCASAGKTGYSVTHFGREMYELDIAQRQNQP